MPKPNADRSLASSLLPSMLAVAAPVALLAALAGCGDPCASFEHPSVELGTGVEQFEPVQDHQVLPVTRGSQGGRHVYGSLRATDVHPGSEDPSQALRNGDRPWVEFELEAAEGFLSNENRSRPPLLPPEDGETVGLVGRIVDFRYWATLPDGWDQIDPADREAALEAMDMVLRVRVEDSCGAAVEDERTIRVDFDPDQP